jgi:hypothetical protein
VREERIRPDVPPGYGLIMMYIEVFRPLDPQNPQEDAKNKIDNIIKQLNEELRDSAGELLCSGFRYDWALREGGEGA